MFKVSTFLLFVGFSFLLIAMEADGYTDDFYLKFSSPKQHSLILGTSRAAQGIMPKEMNKVLGRNDIFNYAFTVAHSPYGPTYLESVKKKINKKTTNGIFILAVDPWSISSTCDQPNDIEQFRELKLCVANTPIVHMNPNVWYIMRNVKDRYHLLEHHSYPKLLHNDGWLEISIAMDLEAIKKRELVKFKEYREVYSTKFKFSTVRFQNLINLISFLKKHGEVYLVRLPVHPKMQEIENNFMPNFNARVTNISKEMLVSYFDMSNLNSEYMYTDGNHLYKESAKEVSHNIGKWILDQ